MRAETQEAESSRIIIMGNESCSLGRGRSGMRRNLEAVINGGITDGLMRIYTGHSQSNNSSDLGGVKAHRTE